MRISVLQQREPFGNILESTLTTFVREVLGCSSVVHWYERWGATRQTNPQEQLWLCNIYLNAIFVPTANQSIFDPIRREFARSVVAWRRPLQRAYVALALSRLGAAHLAQSGMSLTPGLPCAEQLLIVPGNHKIRVLDYHTRTVYGILKSGFAPEFVRREIETRRLAGELGLPVPALDHVSPDGSWFKERYVSGTPLNRLAEPVLARCAVKDAAAAMSVLLNRTLCEQPLDEYTEGLAARARSLISASALLSVMQKQSLFQSINRLLKVLSVEGPSIGGRVNTAMTHGDFQPANILLNRDGVWLIDWEYSARRQAGYDALVFALGARSVDGLAQRIQTLLHNTVDVPFGLLSNWPGVEWQRPAARQVYLWLFLLEELVLHLEENANTLFCCLGQALLNVERELTIMTETVNVDIER
jgi:hypothetical protein